jgi:hypothetical protein
MRPSRFWKYQASISGTAIFSSSDGWMRVTPRLSQRRAPLDDVAEQRDADQQQHAHDIERHRQLREALRRNLRHDQHDRERDPATLISWALKRSARGAGHDQRGQREQHAGNQASSGGSSGASTPAGRSRSAHRHRDSFAVVLASAASHGWHAGLLAEQVVVEHLARDRRRRLGAEAAVLDQHGQRDPRLSAGA